MIRAFIIAATLLLSFGLNAYSDTIYLKSGGRLEGDIVAEDEDRITLKTGIGTMIFERDSIDKIEGVNPAPAVEIIKPEVEIESVETTPLVTQAEAPDFGEILSLKIPEESSKIAEIINSYYYSYLDKNIDFIRFRITDINRKRYIEC